MNGYGHYKAKYQLKGTLEVFNIRAENMDSSPVLQMCAVEAEYAHIPKFGVDPCLKVNAAKTGKFVSLIWFGIQPKIQK